MAYNLGNYQSQLSIGDYNKALANSGSAYQLPERPSVPASRYETPNMSGNAYNNPTGSWNQPGAEQSQQQKVDDNRTGLERLLGVAGQVIGIAGML